LIFAFFYFFARIFRKYFFEGYFFAKTRYFLPLIFMIWLAAQ